MYGQDILSGTSRGTFEIQHKIAYPYIENMILRIVQNVESSYT